jgi:N-sulfoglucosamine sulfohydrolase
MASVSKKFIDENTTNPFFLYFCTSDPHRGGGIVKDNPFMPDRFGNRDEGYDGVERVLTRATDVAVPDFLPNNQACREELAQYYESVNRVDQGVGKLIQYLKDAGVYDNTIIMYISDNGIAFPGAKTNLYNPGMRLPCIIRNPLIPRVSETSDAMINWADLTPTILDFAGVYKPELLSDYLPENEKSLKAKGGIPVYNYFHGKSFKQVMETGDISGWDETYASHTFHEITMYYPMRVAMDKKYKLIWNIAHGLEYPFASDLWASATWQSVINDENSMKMYGSRPVDSYLNRPKFELFDIESDPRETKNLADDPNLSDILEKMKANLKSFQERTQDPWIVKWKHE